MKKIVVRIKNTEKNWIVWIKNANGETFYLVQGDKWADTVASGGRFTQRGAARLQTMKADLCLGKPDPNGASEIYACGTYPGD